MKISELLIEEEEVKAGEFPKLKIGDIDPRNGKKILSAATDGSGYVIRSRFGDIWNVKYGEPDKKPEPTPAAAPVSTPAAASEPTAVEPATTTPVAQPDTVTSTDLPTPPAADDKKPEEKPEEKCGPEVKEKIKQQKTFNAAYKMAKDAGCADFDWCQIINVPSQGNKTLPVMPPSETGKRQWDWKSGELTNRPGSDLPPAAESIELEDSTFISGSLELDRIREIAGTAVVEQTTKPSDPKTKCSLCGVAYDQHIRPDGTSIFRHPFVVKQEGKANANSNSTQSNTPTSSSDKIPEIKASTKEKAIEIARRQGIKRFRFCGKYKVQGASTKNPGGRASSPTPAPAQRRQWNWQSGELTNQPGSDLPPSA